jgi:hypothetical protein
MSTGTKPARFIAVTRRLHWNPKAAGASGATMRSALPGISAAFALVFATGTGSLGAPFGATWVKFAP